MEVPPRFELGIRELQSHALPLGYGTKSIFLDYYSINPAFVKGHFPKDSAVEACLRRNHRRHAVCTSSKSAATHLQTKLIGNHRNKL